MRTIQPAVSGGSETLLWFALWANTAGFGAFQFDKSGCAQSLKRLVKYRKCKSAKAQLWEALCDDPVRASSIPSRASLESSRLGQLPSPAGQLFHAYSQ